MGRSAVEEKDLRAIVKRLRRWFTECEPALRSDGEPNLSEIERRTRIPRTTISGWLGEGAPKGKKVADVPHLLELARREKLSLNWLLLGEGPERLNASTTDATLASEIRQRVGDEVQRRMRVAPSLLERVMPPAEDQLRQAIEHAAENVLAELDRRRHDVKISQIYALLNRPVPSKRAGAQQRNDSALEQLKQLLPITPEASRAADEAWELQVQHEIDAATVEHIGAE